MSIVLLISPKAGVTDVEGASRTIPIATQEIFRQYWKQGGEILGLRWVPMFETGIPLHADDIPHVVVELEKLAAWGRRSDIPSSVVARMDLLVEALLNAQQSTDLDVFVG